MLGCVHLLLSFLQQWAEVWRFLARMERWLSFIFHTTARECQLMSDVFCTRSINCWVFCLTSIVSQRSCLAAWPRLYIKRLKELIALWSVFVMAWATSPPACLLDISLPCCYCCWMHCRWIWYQDCKLNVILNRNEKPMVNILFSFYQIPVSWCSIYDPVFTVSECETLRELGLTVLTENEVYEQAFRTIAFWSFTCWRYWQDLILLWDWARIDADTRSHM